MSPAVRIIVTLVVVGVVAGAGGWMLTRASVPPIEQPIAFSHKVHVQGEELECRDCHGDARKSPHAGYPDLRNCYDCHSEAEGDHPDEPRVREFASKGMEIPWVPVNRNAGHVYFSHRAHVIFAEMECAECHGKIEELDEPPSRPRPELHSMEACVDCHRRREASLECAACHR